MRAIDQLRQELAEILGTTRVSTRAEDRATYARDMWSRTLIHLQHTGALGEPLPDLVVWPETVEEVVSIVSLARRHHVPLVPYGGGSGVCGGVVPVRGGISVDLKRMNRLLHVDGQALVCEAEAGIWGEHLERTLNHHGFTLGHFPSSIYCSTLGGWIACRSAGQASSKYGKIEDMVRGISAVTGRGEIITTDVNADAHDLTQLLIGSEGTLAAITSARLHIHPLPTWRAYRGFAFPNVATGLEAMRSVMQQGLLPTVLRLYDPLDSLSALWGKPKALVEKRNTLSLKPWQQELLLHALSRPGGWQWLAEKLIAKMPLGRRCLLIVGVEGTHASTEADAVFAILQKMQGRDLGAAPGNRWLAHRYDVSYQMSKIFALGAFVDTMELATTWDGIGELYEQVRRVIWPHALVMAHFSHAYPEGCSVYFTFVGTATTGHDAEEKYRRIWQDGLQTAQRLGATLSHHHGVGLLKAPFMAREHGPAMTLLNAAKRAFDPDGILNPGKLDIQTSDFRPLTSGPETGSRKPEGEGPAILTKSLLAHIPAQWTIRQCEAYLNEHDFTLGPVSADIFGRTLNDMILYSADPYLRKRLHVISLSAQLPDGSLVAHPLTPRRAAGPEWMHLYWNSRGALGHLLSVTLCIFPRTLSPVVPPTTRADEAPKTASAKIDAYWNYIIEELRY